MNGSNVNNLRRNIRSGLSFNQVNNIEPGEGIESDTYKKLLDDIDKFKQDVKYYKEDEKGEPKTVSKECSKAGSKSLFNLYNEISRKILYSNLKESIKKELQENIVREFKNTVNLSLVNETCCDCKII